MIDLLIRPSYLDRTELLFDSLFPNVRKDETVKESNYVGNKEITQKQLTVASPKGATNPEDLM